jgi:hypothetical protein
MFITSLLSDAVTISMVVTFWSTFIFQVNKMGQGKGVVSSFQLVLENTGSWSFLQVGAWESGGRSLLLVGAREFMDL